ncbi:MAG: DNA-3-methyladenine glycosylase [Planctomycetes bacterium]|nr:DNA-3-methyladenine glycosylase [Planctomycetota bacterium]
MRRMLPRSFFARDTATVAASLLGKRLVRAAPEGTVSGLIVEVEAYLPRADPASHAHRGRTRRNDAMFGPPGRAYVYTIHTRHCVNVVTESEGVGAAVLIRAVEPERGLDVMAERRGAGVVRDLARGPGRLCDAFAITMMWNRWDLTQGEGLWIERGPRLPAWSMGVSPRIGIRKAAEAPLRFFVLGHAMVSGRRGCHADVPKHRWLTPRCGRES